MSEEDAPWSPPSMAGWKQTPWSGDNKWIATDQTGKWFNTDTGDYNTDAPAWANQFPISSNTPKPDDSVEGFNLGRETLLAQTEYGNKSLDVQRAGQQNALQIAMLEADGRLKIAQMQAELSREQIAAQMAMEAAKIAAQRELAARDTALQTWKAEFESLNQRRRPGYAAPVASAVS